VRHIREDAEGRLWVAHSAVAVQDRDGWLTVADASDGAADVRLPLFFPSRNDPLGDPQAQPPANELRLEISNQREQLAKEQTHRANERQSAEEKLLMEDIRIRQNPPCRRASEDHP